MGHPPAPPDTRSTRPKVDADQLWSGGVATAIVAGLVALVGVLVWRWLFSVPILVSTPRPLFFFRWIVGLATMSYTRGSSSRSRGI